MHRQLGSAKKNLGHDRIDRYGASTSNPYLWRQGSHLDVGLAVLSWRSTTREQQPNGRWSLNQSPTGTVPPLCENTRAAWQLFFTARTWAKPHRFDSSVTLLLRRVVQSKTQWHSNVLKLLKLLQKSSQASKTFFQLLQIKRLQLKLTNNLQNSYQISSQHQVPKTWVKQHPKTPKTTKTNENPSPSSSMHKLVPFGSKLVPIGSYEFYSSQIGSYKMVS